MSQVRKLDGGGRRAHVSTGVTPNLAQQPYRARDLVRVPGLLSLCRLPLAIVFPFCVGRPALALAVLAAAAGSDVLDGWYARRFHEETRTGALLDGVMDKVFVLAVLGTLVVSGSLTILQLLLLGARELGELALIATALVLKPRPLGSHRSASVLGKLATVLQFVTVVLVIVHAPYLNVAVAVTAACGALAAAEYWRNEWGAAAT